MASEESCWYFNSAAQRDIFSVIVSLVETALVADKRCSLFGSYVLRILEWKKCHEIGVMDDERFRRSLDQIPFSSVSGDDVADCVRNAALQRHRDSSEGMAKRLSPFTLPAFTV